MRRAPESSSFRDPDSLVFTADGVICREINRSYCTHYDRLMESGLYAKLVRAGLMVAHDEGNPHLAWSADAYKVILPDPIPFISYPYEWSFSQLKAAALATLEIQRQASAFGMVLKDASAYNIQFVHGKPKLVDTTSFQIYREGLPWAGYRQFCQHFLAPLTLMSCTDVRLNQLMKIYIDGIPLDLTAKLLNFTSKLRFPTLIHICLHSWSQRRFADRSLSQRARSGQVSLRSLLGLVQSLESAIQRLNWVPKSGSWSRYYQGHTYDLGGLEQKKELVSSFLDSTESSAVWDLGANIGIFSRIASGKGMQTVAWEADPECVELNYRQILAANEINLLPLVVDFANPTPAIGWDNAERESFAQRGPTDTVLALALIHHLAIANNVPLSRIAGFFARLCKWLIIEFIPKDDPGVERLLTVRKDIFEGYRKEEFENAFREYFIILKEQRIVNSQRILYLMSKISEESRAGSEHA